LNFVVSPVYTWKADTVIDKKTNVDNVVGEEIII